jgi:hypothetical protein
VGAALTERLRWFTWRRQRLGRAAASVDEALRDVIAVYSSHPSAPITLLARTGSFTAEAFTELDRERALRLPGRSVFLMPKETAHLVFRAVPEPAARRAYVLKYFDLSAADYEKRKKRVVATARKEPVAPDELRRVTGVEKGSMLVSLMCRDGVLRRVGSESLRSNSLRYVPARIQQADPDEALAWLAREYLRAFGPARPKDFQWWTGAPPKRAAAALAEVETVELDGGLLLRAEDAKEFESVEPPPAGTIDVIPKWDALTMGYEAGGRARFVSPRHQDRAYDFRGDGIGLVLLDGQAIGAWTSRFTGKHMEVTADWFRKPPKKVLDAVRERFDEIAKLLGASGLKLG